MQPDSLNVIRPGSPVKIGEAVKGVVTAVFLRHSGFVEYEVVWWVENTRYEVVVPEYEVTLEDRGTRKLGIGFHA